MPRMRYTSGGKEGEVLSRARALEKDYTLLLPRSPDGKVSDLFPRLEQDLKTVQKFSEDASQLERLMFRGEPLARAYAGLLHYALERPTLNHLVARFPTGDIPFLPFERVPKEELIAVQYYDDPRRLILGYLQYAKPGLFGGGGNHFYAVDRNVVCTGKADEPPATFVESTVRSLPYRLQPLPADGKGESGLGCVHLARGDREPYLEIDWPSAHQVLRVCVRCLSEDRHLLASLNGSMVVPDPDSEFSVKGIYPLEHRHAGPCPAPALPSLSRRAEGNYRAGRISDAELLKELVQESEAALRSYRGLLLIAGGVCFGDEVKPFVDALGATTAERKALQEVLGRLGEPLLLSELSAGKVVDALWKDHAQELLEAVGASPEEAERIAQEGRGRGRSAEQLNRLARLRAEEATVAELPRYRELSPEARLADELARAYRRGGTQATERRISLEDPPEGKIRGMAWAFLVALGKEQGQAWRFSDTEKEFGQALVPSVDRLLKAPPGEYHQALEQLLTEAGVTHWGSLEPPSAPS